MKRETIAIKEFTPAPGMTEVDTCGEGSAQARAWEVYQNASCEARTMSQLDHPHVLCLVGITFQPIRLLLEFAPLGDLKHCVQQFRKAQIKLSRRTLKATLIQVNVENELQRFALTLQKPI